MKFEMVQIHFLSDVFGLSSRNYATMATSCKDFSSLFALLSAAKFSTEFKVQE